VLSPDESAKAWDTARDALPDGHALHEAQYLVQKLEPLETADS